MCAAHFPIRDLLQLFPQSGTAHRQKTLQRNFAAEKFMIIAPTFAVTKTNRHPGKTGRKKDYYD